jgi:3-isopropylmalate/(R)-2-methylmalate dehydratase large subunit
VALSKRPDTAQPESADQAAGRQPDERNPQVRRTVHFARRVLYLTEDADLLNRQIKNGLDLAPDPSRALINNISTDEITPGWVCFYYDETLGEYCLVGLRGNHIKHLTVKNGGFDVIVSGQSKGCGSSRETAPYSELTAGIKLVVAKSIEKIYGQNCQNIGLLTTTDFSILDRIQRGEEIELSEFTKGLDPISKSIVEFGGLFSYNKARMKGGIAQPIPSTKKRPMNLCEKIIAKNAIADPTTGRLGVEAVRPGDALFCYTDVRFTHDYVTAMAESLWKQGFGAEARVTDPKSVWAFRDHLTFLPIVMPEEHKKMGLLEKANKLAVVQEQFTTAHDVKLYGEVQDGGSEAICHNAVLEDIALPGQLVVGTDSHTCTAGALGCFAFGVGSTDMANAWFTKDIRVKVPQSVKFILKGQKKPNVAAKDVMLYVMAQPYIKGSKAIGQVLEFSGEGLKELSFDERATMTNMAVEAGATTGIIEPDEIVVEYLARMRGLDPVAVRKMMLFSDPDAEYAAVFEIDLQKIDPMVALPGDPRNGVEITKLEGDIPVDIAYGGSCTGGKMADMDMYAEVLSRAVKENKRVAKGVKFYIQFGSQRIKQYAIDRGYLEIFEKAGAELINPSCGACIKAGPGVSDRPDQVSISAINRNFPGRSGPGKVYLASPLVVAASAIAGKIVPPDRI